MWCMTTSAWTTVNVKAVDLIWCCFRANENDDNDNLTMIKSIFCPSNHPQAGLWLPPAYILCFLQNITSFDVVSHQWSRQWSDGDGGRNSDMYLCTLVPPLWCVNTLNCSHASARPYARRRGAVVRILFPVINSVLVDIHPHNACGKIAHMWGQTHVCLHCVCALRCLA